MNRFFFLDMEMTGLDVAANRIIEVAVIITDLNFKEIERYQAVIRQPLEFLNQMDEWNKRTHTDSGLLNEIPRGKPQIEVEMELIDLVKKHFPRQKVMLTGNSISQDKLFIEAYMKKFAEYLHYRIIDISSMKAIFQYVRGIRFQKGNTHRAIDDVQKSIDELKLYVSLLDENKMSAYRPKESDGAGLTSENPFYD